jgi:hypothetical protein
MTSLTPPRARIINEVESGECSRMTIFDPPLRLSLIKTTLGLRTNVLSVAFLLAILSSFQSANAANVTSCPAGACWTEIGPPVYAALGPYQSIEISYVSDVNAATTGIVFMVVHNYLGQTVEISTATLALAADANGTAFPIAFGLASGQYSATLFATSTSGVAISEATTAPFTV